MNSRIFVIIELSTLLVIACMRLQSPRKTIHRVPMDIAVLMDIVLQREQPWSTRRAKVTQHLLHTSVVMASECTCNS
ncbi:hypothetical protein BC835DRAFT_1342830 [Cytidiella melzeri]|nr:hypothetical protein BC835DRAFT_1342830 [Cytidiella melzeri]